VFTNFHLAILAVFTGSLVGASTLLAVQRHAVARRKLRLASAGGGLGRIVGRQKSRPSAEGWGMGLVFERGRQRKRRRWWVEALVLREHLRAPGGGGEVGEGVFV